MDREHKAPGAGSSVSKWGSQIWVLEPGGGAHQKLLRTPKVVPTLPTSAFDSLFWPQHLLGFVFLCPPCISASESKTLGRPEAGWPGPPLPTLGQGRAAKSQDDGEQLAPKAGKEAPCAQRKMHSAFQLVALSQA